MMKYLFFNKNISKTDKELINKMNNELNLSSKDINILKKIKINFPDYFTNKVYENDLIINKINEFDFGTINKNVESFKLTTILKNTDSAFRKIFFENDIKDSEKDKIKIYIYQDNTNPIYPVEYYYCYFNKNIYDKLKDKKDVVAIQEYIEKKQPGLYFFCKSYNTINSKIINYEYAKEVFKYEINKDLDLTIKME